MTDRDDRAAAGWIDADFEKILDGNAPEASSGRGISPDPPMAWADSAVGTRKQVPF